MRNLAFVAAITGFAAAPAVADDTNRFTVIIDPSSPGSVWRIDTSNGAVSRCEAKALNAEPVCSPWSDTGSDQPIWRYDPQAKKLIPTNEAARRRAAEQKNSN